MRHGAPDGCRPGHGGGDFRGRGLRRDAPRETGRQKGDRDTDSSGCGLAGHAHTPEERSQMMQRGLGCSLSVITAIRSAGFRGAVVYLGGATSYGATGIPHHPSARLEPSNFRGVVKAAESLMFRQFARETGSAVTELRLFSVYGPWEQRGRLLPKLFAAALTGERVKLTPRPYKRDWVYVEDVAQACLQACARTTEEPAVFNVCSGRLHDTHELAQTAERITGRDLISLEPFAGNDAYADPYPLGVLPTAQEGFEWRPEHDMEAALQEYWAWARSDAGRRYLTGPTMAA
jgi:nucleoside-diphosphate-sugar epimerase